MAVTATMPGQVASKANLANWGTGTYKCALMNSLAAYAQDTTDFWDDLDQDEVANGNGYTTGGNTLTTFTVSYDAATNRNRFRAVVPAWTSSGAGFSAVGAVIYEDTGGAATADPVIAVIDFGETLTASNGGTFTITLDATLGAFYTTAA
jgi:hypothetical protein